MKKASTRTTFLLVDAGNIFQMAMLSRYPAQWMTCGASGVPGWEIPAAFAVRSLFPKNPVLLLVNESNFLSR